MSYFFFPFPAGVFLVGEKGEQGPQGPPGRCDCNTVVGANNAPFGHYYTQRRGSNKLTAVRFTQNITDLMSSGSDFSAICFLFQIFVVSSEEEMGRITLDNAIALRRDQRMLYFKDKDGWSPLQVQLYIEDSKVSLFFISIYSLVELILASRFPQPFQPFQSTEKVPDRVGVCGDGKVQAQHGEECDDGNQIVTDACLSE